MIDIIVIALLAIAIPLLPIALACAFPIDSGVRAKTVKEEWINIKTDDPETWPVEKRGESILVRHNDAAHSIEILYGDLIWTAINMLTQRRNLKAVPTHWAPIHPPKL
jgi:hypothetical protein